MSLTEGQGFDGSSIEGFARIDESDMVAMPDPSTFAILPWRPKEGGAVARMFCDMLQPSLEPYDGDPRYVLKRALAKASEIGLHLLRRPRAGVLLLQGRWAEAEVLDRGGYFDLTPLDIASDLRRETVLTLEDMGIGVEYSHHEVAPSQHEIDLRYTDALTMADNAMTYRLVVKEIAMKHGVYATFMPKPLFGAERLRHAHASVALQGRQERLLRCQGRGPSLQARDALYRRPAEARPGDLAGYEPVGEQLQAAGPGLRGADLSLLGAAQPLRPDPRAAVQAGQREGDPHRVPRPDPACNPYLAFAVMLTAGLEGIEKGYECPPPVEQNVYHMPDEEQRRLGIEPLPRRPVGGDRSGRGERAAAPHPRRPRLREVHREQEDRVAQLSGAGLGV